MQLFKVLANMMMAQYIQSLFNNVFLSTWNSTKIFLLSINVLCIHNMADLWRKFEEATMQRSGEPLSIFKKFSSKEKLFRSTKPQAQVLYQSMNIGQQFLKEILILAATDQCKNSGLAVQKSSFFLKTDTDSQLH